MHDEIGPGRRGQLRGPPRRRQRAAERFLADDPADPTFQRLFDERGMRVGRTGDIEDIDGMRPEKGVQIRVTRHARRTRRVRIGIGDGDQPRPVNLLPGGMMELREIAGADTRHVEIRCDHTTSYIGNPATGKARNTAARARVTLFLPPPSRLTTDR